MKVLFFLSDISLRGGTERACIAVCNELAKLGYHVFIFSVGGNIKKPAFPVHESIHIAGLGINHSGLKIRLLLPKIFLELRKFIKRNEISTLINVEVMACLFTFPFFLLPKKKLHYIVWEHFNYRVDLGLKQRTFFRKLAAKNADAIITLTQKDRSMWMDNLKPKAQVVTIYNPSPFPLSDSPYQSHSKSILAVGRYTYQKGYDLLIESWKILQEMGNEQVSGWHLSIIGNGEDKPAIENLIDQLAVADSVSLIPNTNSISTYYQNASFLCMSSRFEGLPMVLIEAQSHGLPIVAFDCLTGPADIIIEGSGYLCQALDTDCLANKMLKMITNVEDRKNMSDQAKLASNRFAPEEIVKTWDSFLQSL